MEYFKFKSALKVNDLRMIHPKLLIMFAFVLDWATQRSLPIVVTSMIRTPEENRQLGSKSFTHPEGRAFDISIRGWSTDEIDDLIHEVNDKFSDIGALTTSGESRPVVFHDNGNGPHFHFQIRRI